MRGSVRYVAYELHVLFEQYRTHTKETDVWAFGMTVFVSFFSKATSIHTIQVLTTGTPR